MIDTEHTISPGWQNENALRAYPLTDDAPAAAVIPPWLVTDLRVTVDASIAVVYLSSAYLSDTLVSVGISGKTGNNPPVGLLTKTVTRDALEPDRAYSLDALSSLASGTISFGKIPADATNFRAAFTHEQAPLAESALIRVRRPGVTGLVDNEHGIEVSGLIDLSGNSEFRTYRDPSDVTGHTAVLELTDLYRDLTTSVCSSSPTFSSCGETPIKTINGVAPDASGVITIRFR